MGEWFKKRLEELDTRPEKVYANFKDERGQLLRDHRGKNPVGTIYYLINKINGHSYVGCSKNIESRMKNYLNISYLISKKNANQPIIKALLKYGLICKLFSSNNRIYTLRCII